MKRLSILAVLSLTLFVVASAQATTPAQYKAQVKAQKAKVAKLTKQLAAKNKADAATITGLQGQVTTLATQLATANGQLAAANTASGATIAGLNNQVAALTAQVTAQAQGGLTAVLHGSPTDMWNAVVAIWQVFPMEAPGVFCGFDKRDDIVGGTGLNITDYTFEDDTNC